MRNSLMICTVATCAIVCATTIVEADIIGPFEVQAVGEASIDESSITMTNLAVIDQQPSLNFQLADVTLLLDDPGPPQSIIGSFTLSGDSGSLSADIVSGAIFGFNSNFATAAGDFVITGGTGLFEGIIGQGSFNSFTNMNTGETQIKIGGKILPAPSALALLGIAGCCGRRRRRNPNAGDASSAAGSNPH